MHRKNIMICAGEASGDLHGAALIHSMKELYGELSFFGTGGKCMQLEGVTCLFKTNQLSFLGIQEIVKHLPFILKVYKTLVFEMERIMPDVLILIDYPGLNLKLAAKAHKLGIPIIYYISPQVWAWGRTRVRKIKKYVTRMLLIFPFEENFYKENGIDAVYVGHPFMDKKINHWNKNEFFKLIGIKSEVEKIIGILPGSRNQEIQKILPVLLKSGELIGRKFENVKFLVAPALSINMNLCEKILKNYRGKFYFVPGRAMEVMQVSDLVLVASGTATLECALAETPMIIVYKTSMITWIIGKMLIKIPYLGMVNLVAGKKIVPEFIQYQATPEKIAEESIKLLQDEIRIKQIVLDLKGIKKHLGESGASVRAAREVLHILKLD